MSEIRLAHVGLGKAASTYLQKHYFSKIGQPFFSTQPPFIWPENLGFVFETNKVWYEDILASSTILSRQEREKTYRNYVGSRFEVWENAAKKFFVQTETQPILLSSEGLSGLSLPIAEHHAKLLKSAGITRIVFITRRQADYAVSLWRQFLLAEDRFARFVPFEALFHADTLGEVVIDMDWIAFIEILDSVFGQENVLVLPYEMLTLYPDNFFVLLNHFLGVEDSFMPPRDKRENSSCRDEYYRGLKLDHVFPLARMRRVRAWLHRHIRNYPFIAQDYSMNIPDESLKRISMRYRQSNLQLEERMSMNLKTYEYL